MLLIAYRLFLNGIVSAAGTLVSRSVYTVDIASKRHVHAPGAITKDDVERYKQAFARPGSLTAAINYYRAIIDAATWAPPTTKRRVQGHNEALFIT